MNKEDFPILNFHNELVYLDSAATSQKPQVVIDSLTNFYTFENANVHRGLYSLSEQATAKYEEARIIVAKHFGASPEEIIFTSGTTAGLNYVSLSLIPDLIIAGEENVLLTSKMEHHASMLPIQQASVNNNIKIDYLGLDDNYQLDLEELEAKLKQGNVRALALTHMSNVLGTITPIATVVKLVRLLSPETIIIVDGAQYAPHYQLDLHKLDVDFYALSGHKMLGPTGIGVLYGKSELLRKMNPAIVGGGMINKVDYLQSSWADIPAKHEAGTPNIAGAIALAEAIRYLQKIGMHKVVAHEEELTSYLIAKLISIEGVSILGPESSQDRGGVVSFNVDKVHAHDIAQLLAERNIAVRAGHHCNQILLRDVLKTSATVRASIYLYNDYQDIDKLAATLVESIKKFRK